MVSSSSALAAGSYIQVIIFRKGKADFHWRMVSVLHICPEANREFRERVTSPHLEEMFPNKGILEIWKGLVPEDKFMSISVEDLLDIRR